MTNRDQMKLTICNMVQQLDDEALFDLIERMYEDCEGAFPKALHTCNDCPYYGADSCPRDFDTKQNTCVKYFTEYANQECFRVVNA